MRGLLRAVVLVVAVGSTADAARKRSRSKRKPTPVKVQPKGEPKQDPPPLVKEDDGGGEAGPKAKGGKKVKVFDFGAIGIEGTMKTPQLLYFLSRVREELDRASLEKRSFMPELVRSVDEGNL